MRLPSRDVTQSDRLEKKNEAYFRFPHFPSSSHRFFEIRTRTISTNFSSGISMFSFYICLSLQPSRLRLSRVSLGFSNYPAIPVQVSPNSMVRDRPRPWTKEHGVGRTTYVRPSEAVDRVDGETNERRCRPIITDDSAANEQRDFVPASVLSLCRRVLISLRGAFKTKWPLESRGVHRFHGSSRTIFMERTYSLIRARTRLKRAG